MIRLTVPSIDDAEIAAAAAVLESGFLVQGPRVADLETQVASRVGTRHAIAVSSGTAALHVALNALDTQPGQIVLTSAYSWPATANVIELCAATPGFIDLDEATANLCPTRLAERLHDIDLKGEIATVAAILPVHLFGHLADMPAILEVAARYDLPVIEDAACALGSQFQGRSAGSWGQLGCFSFHPRKAITTGEGGMVTTDDDRLADSIRSLRNHGLDPTADSPQFIRPGFNYRLTDLQAAIGLAQFSKLDRIVAARQAAAVRYDRLLEDSPIATPTPADGDQPNWQSYVVRLPAEVAGDRSNLIARLGQAGIETTIGTWHIPRTRWYSNRYGFGRGDFPVADRLFETHLTLPLYEGLEETDQRTVVDRLNHCLLAATP
jgi:dTDP-4-amino-4,6-dideoxygalactose transaminase